MSSVELFRSEVMEARRTRLVGELILKPVGRSWVTALVATGLLVSIAVWSLQFDVPKIETVDGVIDSDSPVAKVVVPEQGVLLTLNVSEGQFVKKGTIVAVVAIDRKTGTTSGVGADALASLSQQEGLSQRARSLDARTAIYDRIELRQRLEALQRRISDLEAQKSVQAEIVENAQASLASIAPLAERGLVTRDVIDERRRTLLLAKKDLAELAFRLSEAIGEAQGAKTALLRAVPVAGGKAIAAEEAALTLRRERAAALGQTRYVLVAPCDGQISGIQVAVGQSLAPGKVIASVSPASTSYHAVLFIPSRSIGNIAAGQRVNVRLDAYPYETFGSIQGAIKNVSATAMMPAELSAYTKVAEPVYVANVDLQTNALRVNKRAMPLRTGMRTTALVQVETRSLAGWIVPAGGQR